MRIVETFSQHHEDVAIAAALAGSGLPYSPWFVDVGANDGQSWSNSRFFGRLGWHLLLIEPIRRFADQCTELYAGNQRVIVEELAISATAGTTDFFLTNDPDRDLLQMSSSLSAENDFGYEMVKTTVATAPLHSLLSAHDVPRDYAVLSVDAEGHDLTVLETARLETWRPRVICVEMIPGTPAGAPIDAFLVAQGYRHAITTEANTLYLLAD